MKVFARPDSKKRMNQIRRLNKWVLNPFMKPFAGRRYIPYALIEHTGRRSGKRYRTPVLAIPTRKGFVIPLTYGDATDWFRNLRKEKEALLKWRGEIYRVGKPVIVEAEQALSAFPRWMQWTLNRWGISRYLQLQQMPEETHERSLFNGRVKLPTFSERVKQGLVFTAMVFGGLLGVRGARRMVPAKRHVHIPLR